MTTSGLLDDTHGLTFFAQKNLKKSKFEFASHAFFFSRTFICAHALAWLKVLQHVSLSKKERSSTCQQVSDRSLSLHPLISSSLSSVSTSCPISSSLLFCSSSMWSEPPSTRTPEHPQNEEYGLVNPLTGYEPTQLDNFDYSETCTAISSRMNPSTWTRNRRTRSMRNSTMNLSEKRFLHHCSLRSKKNQRT